MADQHRRRAGAGGADAGAAAAGVERRRRATASSRWREDRGVGRLLGDVPHRDRDAVDGPGAGGAHRQPQQRQGAGDVGHQPDPVAAPATRDPGAVLGRASTSTLRGGRGRAALARATSSSSSVQRRPTARRASPASAAARPARRARRTSPARQAVHAFGDGGPGVGLGEHLEQVQRRRVDRPRARRAAAVAGSSRSRVVAVSGEQQVVPDQRARRRRRPRAAKPIRAATVGRDRLPGDAVVDPPSAALADVVQQRGDAAAGRAGRPGGSAARPRRRSRRRAGRR